MPPQGDLDLPAPLTVVMYPFMRAKFMDRRTHGSDDVDGMHRCGFEATRELVETLGGRKALHGHHQVSNGVEWIGLDTRQILTLHGQEIWQ